MNDVFPYPPLLLASLSFLFLLSGCEIGGVDSGYPRDPNPPPFTPLPDMAPPPYMPPPVVNPNNSTPGNNFDPGFEDMGPNYNRDGLSVGSPCVADTDCRGYGGCIKDPDAPGGYCITAMCETLGCEDERDVCQILQFEDANISICLKGCSTREDCRPGYDCLPLGDTFACWTEQATMPGNNGTPTPGDGEDGAPCAADTDCAGALCILDADGWPQGYCSTPCFIDTDCHGDANGARCVTDFSTGASLCQDTCDKNADCRTGYRCEREGLNAGTCAPNTLIAPGAKLANLPFDTRCVSSTDGLAALDFDVASNTSSYTIVLHGDFSNVDFSQETPYIELFAVERPMGDDLTLGVGPLDYGDDLNNLLSGLPSFALTIPSNPGKRAQIQPGAHRAVAGTNAREICYYVLQEDQPGERVDLNIHFIESMGLNANSAPSNPAFTRMLQGMHTQLIGAGIQLGHVRFIDVETATAQRYQAPNFQQLFALATEVTRSPGPEIDDALSLNIVFVPRFSPELPFLGLSLGINAPPGLHGTPMSMTVASSEYLFMSHQDINGNAIDGGSYMALTLVHELGHFLGLHHTTEVDLDDNDPLSDTPACTRAQLMMDYTSCPDVSNAMFPYISHPSPSLSSQQRTMLQFSPLTKPPLVEQGP